jgi:hypothetical protein
MAAFAVAMAYIGVTASDMVRSIRVFALLGHCLAILNAWA